MNIEEFVSGFNKARDKHEYIVKNLKTDYLPYSVKCSESKKIVNAAMYETIDGEKVFKYNKPSVYFLMVMAVFSNYFDIDYGNHSWMEVFDMLEKNYITDDIVEIPDVNSFRTVLNMVVNDEIDFHNDIVSYFDNKIKAFLKSMKVSEEYILPLLQDVSEVKHDA